MPGIVKCTGYMEMSEKVSLISLESDGEEEDRQ